MKRLKDILFRKNTYINLLLIFLILLLLLIITAQNYRDFSSIKLRKNKKNIFNISDLKVGDLKYLSTDDDVINRYAKPKKEEIYDENGFSYKLIEYDGLKLTLKKYYNEYVLVKAEITDKKYITSRKIKVGSKISKVLNSYYIQNKNTYYMYGNYTIKSLGQEDIAENIFFGYREKNKITYVNKDAKVGEDSPLTQMIIYEYKKGKVTKITWSYDLN